MDGIISWFDAGVVTSKQVEVLKVWTGIISVGRTEAGCGFGRKRKLSGEAGCPGYEVMLSFS